MATEVGKAYIALIPSVKGFGSQLQRELSGDLPRVGHKLGEDLGQEVGETAGKEAAGGFKSKLTSGIGKMSALAGGLAIGATLTKGFTDAVSADAATAKMTAQLGLTGEQSATIGKASGELFAQGYGEGADQIREALGLVVRDIDGMGKASKDTLTRVGGKVTDVANIFDQDLGGVTRAVSQMMRTGMAKDADEALDIITKGFQSGVDKSEDFLDTLNEYGTQFRNLGIDGKTATGLLSQGLKGGARDADIVADSLKEFGLRTQGTLETTDKKGKKHLTALGQAFQDVLPPTVDMYDAQRDLAKGGKGARDTLQKMLTGVKGMKDPTGQSADAVALFGTQAEDMGKALYGLDLDTAAKGLGSVKGAADKANESLNNTPSAKLDTFKRSLQQDLTEAMTKYVIPAVETLMPYLTDLAGAFADVLDSMKPVIQWMKDNPAVVKVFAGVVALLALATAAHAIAMEDSRKAMVNWIKQGKIVQAATKVWAAIQWILNSAFLANPITWIVLGIIALIAIIAIVVHKMGGWSKIWETIGNAASTAWKAIKNAFTKIKDKVVGGIKAIFGWVKQNWRPILLTLLLGPFGLVLNQVIKKWDSIKAAVRDGASAVVKFLKGVPGKILALGGKFASAGRELIGRFVDGLKNAAGVVSGIAGNVWDAVKKLLNRAIDGINATLEFTINLPGKDIHINPPDIPHLATGGRATGSTLAVLGEGKEPETILPDSVLRGLLERTAAGAGGGVVGELTITNWEQGTGYFRQVASGEVAEDRRFRRTMGAMSHA